MSKENKKISPDKLFSESLNLAREKRWGECEKALVKYLNMRKNDVEALKLLSFALLKLGDVDEAFRYIERAKRLKPEDTEVLTILSYISLLDGDMAEAVNYLLDAIDSEPDNERLKSTLETIKKYKDPSTVKAKVRLNDYVNLKVLNRKSRPKFVKYGVLLVVILGVVALGIWAMWESENPAGEIGEGGQVGVTKKGNDFENIVVKSKPKIVLSEEDVKKLIRQARQYIYDNRPNRAIMTINKILNSNASVEDKERVRFLMEFINPPDPITIDYNPQYKEVIQRPYIYEGCWVVWKGSVANLKRSQSSTTFDLMVSYVDEEIIEGVVRVKFDSFVHIQPSESVRIFGRLHIKSKPVLMIKINGEKILR